MADDSLGAELKNTKLKACELSWGAEGAGEMFSQRLCNYQTWDQGSQAACYPLRGVREPRTAQIIPCPQHFPLLKVKSFSLLL